MDLSNNRITVSNPTTFPMLFDFLDREPSATLFGGGSWLAHNQFSKTLKLGNSIVNLQSIPELKKIDRTERYLEFGSTATLARIDSLKSQIVPELLHDAIHAVPSPQIRNLATIGGNLSISDFRMSLYPALLVLDASVELRSRSKNRWVPLRSFIKENAKPDIQPGEVLTRVRVPISQWEFQQYKRIGKRTAFNHTYSVLACAAHLYKSTLTEIHLILLDNAATLIRPTQTIGDLNSKPLPLSAAHQNELCDLFLKELSVLPEKLSDETSRRLLRLFRQLLSELNVAAVNAP